MLRASRTGEGRVWPIARRASSDTGTSHGSCARGVPVTAPTRAITIDGANTTAATATAPRASRPRADAPSRAARIHTTPSAAASAANK